MGFITLPPIDTRDKLYAPQCYRHSYLTSDHRQTWGHFQSVPKLNRTLCFVLTSLHEDAFMESDDDFF